MVFDLELDVDVHAGSLPGSRETASTDSGRRLPELGDEVTFRACHVGLRGARAAASPPTSARTASSTSRPAAHVERVTESTAGPG